MKGLTDKKDRKLQLRPNYEDNFNYRNSNKGRQQR